MLTPTSLLSSFILIFMHLKLCLATATHNFKWLKITHISLIIAQIFANVDVLTHISFAKTVIWSTNKKRFKTTTVVISRITDEIILPFCDKLVKIIFFL